MKQLHKRNAVQQSALKNQLKDKDKMVTGYHKLAEDVAIEYSSLKRAAKAETATLKKSADSNLANLKSHGQTRTNSDFVCDKGRSGLILQFPKELVISLF